MKFLVLTVGGSCSQLVTSIEENQPDKVYFICSDDDRTSGNKGSYTAVAGNGKVCGNDYRNPDKPSIVNQTGLSEDDYEIIKIKYFDDHNKCYTACFNLLKDIIEKNLLKFKDKFAKYIGEKLGKDSIVDATTYWNIDNRMQELKHMLTFENETSEWNAKTSYMELEEFKDRRVLPKPSEVVNKNTN